MHKLTQVSSFEGSGVFLGLGRLGRGWKLVTP